MSYLKSVIEKLGFESEQKISAFKELLKLTGLNEIEDDEKGFKSKSAALTHLVELTQGTEDKPAWLRWAGQERWDHNDNESMQINKKEFNFLFNQLALPKEKNQVREIMLWFYYSALNNTVPLTRKQLLHLNGCLL